QLRLLRTGCPHAFYFNTLEAHRHYTITLEGVVNSAARTGAFTTLKAWRDRRAPLAVLAAAGQSTARASPREGWAEATAFDLNLLFVSGTGMGLGIGSGLGPGDGRRCGSEGQAGTGAAAGMGVGGCDMSRELGQELWRPWPQADVVVHTGSQVR
ncbi:unnamed protein product, partial [Discosporangium mesarthrocarpum]